MLNSGNIIPSHSVLRGLFLCFPNSTSLIAKRIPRSNKFYFILSNLFYFFTSDIQLSEESLSQVNGAVKEVTTELETAREEFLALKDTKQSVTKELHDLQQTITGTTCLTWIKVGVFHFERHLNFKIRFDSIHHTDIGSRITRVWMGVL